jgi:hypothetical protein
VSIVSEIAVYLLARIKEQIFQGNLDNLIKCLAFYLMDRSFLADGIFLTDELYRLKVDIHHKEVHLEREQERQLLLNFFISKLTCFFYLISSKKINKYMGRRTSKEEREARNKQLRRSLLLCGLFLFQKCN